MKRACIVLTLALAVPAFAGQPRTGTGQMSTTPVEVGDRTNRVALTIVNEDTTIIIRCSGQSSTAQGSGVGIAGGNAWTIDEQHGGANSATERIFCASASGSPNYSYWETIR